jgi:membrane protease YdiL (CAAX protease family)
VIGFVRWLGGSFPTAYRPATRPTGPFVEAFAVYLLGMVGITAVVRKVVGDRVGATWFVIVILPAVFLWPLLRGVSRADLRAGLGWHRGRGFWREAGAGFVGYLAGLPVLLAGAMVTLLLQRFSGSDTSHPIVNEVGRGGWRTVQLFFLAAVWAPVVEETMFRGAFYHHLRARLPWPLAAGVVALLFAAVHPQGWAAIPVLGAIAMTLATIREWRGSIVASAVAHAVNNGAVTLLLVLLLS